MELKELTTRTLELLGIETTDKMSAKLFEIVQSNNQKTYEQFVALVDGDLTVDWLQMIYQYYQADRKQKMQDYTPKSLADFMGLLAGESDHVVDMCAGSGTLTIQKWNRNHNLIFTLYELDEKVIPFLLFNMAIRNISCMVHQADVLQMEIYKTYKISKGDKFGECKEIKNAYSISF